MKNSQSKWRLTQLSAVHLVVDLLGYDPKAFLLPKFCKTITLFMHSLGFGYVMPRICQCAMHGTCKCSPYFVAKNINLVVCSCKVNMNFTIPSSFITIFYNIKFLLIIIMYFSLLNIHKSVKTLPNEQKDWKQINPGDN